ncbi:MAG TPA: hypothetical protein ENK29_05350 [Chromatiales bacterium]|nr:hypothetical protein [Chromatiales bacterium]
MAIQSVTAAAGLPPCRRAGGDARARQGAVSEATPRTLNLPVERVIEGEVLERTGRASGTGGNDFLERFLTARHSASREAGGLYRANAAIGAYLGNRQLEEALVRQDARRIDCYA